MSSPSCVAVSGAARTRADRLADELAGPLLGDHAPLPCCVS